MLLNWDQMNAFFKNLINSMSKQAFFKRSNAFKSPYNISEHNSKHYAKQYYHLKNKSTQKTKERKNGLIIFFLSDGSVLDLFYKNVNYWWATNWGENCPLYIKILMKKCFVFLIYRYFFFLYKIHPRISIGHLVI